MCREIGVIILVLALSYGVAGCGKCRFIWVNGWITATRLAGGLPRG